MKKTTSFTRYLVEKQNIDGRITPQLRLLLEVVARACKYISINLTKGAINDLLGQAGNQNIQGEAQQKLDLIANEFLIDANEWGGHLAAMASEEMDEIYVVPKRFPQGEYLLLFDPLDGSSNLDIDMSVGTIFSVLKKPEDGHAVTEQDFLQAGVNQVAAGYAIYGPQTQLVLTFGDGVSIFTLDRDLGTFVLTNTNVKIPEQTQEFAINMSNFRHWEQPMQQYVNELLQGCDGPRNKNFNMRWIAAMVGDIHRILTRGGIFMYPWDKREPTRDGKLRLMYEANPMAWIVEQAGGAATNCRQRILDIKPNKLHQRVSVVMGSKAEVELVTNIHKLYDQKQDQQ